MRTASPVRRARAAGHVAACIAVLLPAMVRGQDTVRVEGGDPGRWGDTLEAVPELSIGAVTGDPSVTFGMITGLAVDPEGRIYVADHQVPAIKRFGPDGELLDQIGRSGEGPGEYEQPLDLLTLPGGALALWDFGNRRINLYELDGEFLDSYTVPTSSLIAGRMLYADTAGHLYVRTGLRPRDAGSRHGLIELSADGGVVDTLHLPDRNPDGAYHFERETLWTWTPFRQLVVGENRIRDGPTYRFTIRDEGGSDVVVSRSVEPVELTGEERSEWSDHAAWRERRAQRRDRRVDFPDLPEVKPAFKALQVDEEGRIWVQRYVASEKSGAPRATDDTGEPAITWRERPTYDVFTPDGAYLGTVVLPYRTRWRASRGRTVWGVQRGPMGVSSIVRFHLAEK